MLHASSPSSPVSPPPHPPTFPTATPRSRRNPSSRRTWRTKPILRPLWTVWRSTTRTLSGYGGRRRARGRSCAMLACLTARRGRLSVGWRSECPPPRSQVAAESSRRFAHSHPFASLSGSYLSLAIYTHRYSSSPLIIQGPGYPLSVTAGAVVADAIRVAERYGARVGL